MRTYILRRLLQTIPLLLGVSALTFLVLKLAPGDFLNTMAENPGISAEAIESMRHRFGLDRPWWIQYGLYLENLFLHFDFGESFSRHQPVFTVLREGLGNTLMLATAAAVVTWCLAIPLGALVHRALGPGGAVGAAAAVPRRAHRVAAGRRDAVARLRLSGPARQGL